MNDRILVGFKTKGREYARPSASVQTPTTIRQMPTASVQTPTAIRQMPTAIVQMPTAIRQLLTLIRPTPNRQLPPVIATHRTL